MATPDRRAPGRPAGSVNHRHAHLAQKIKAHMESKYGKRDYDPVIDLLDISQKPDISLDLRVQCVKTVAEYVHSKLKAVEISGSKDQPLEVNMTIASKLAELLD